MATDIQKIIDNLLAFYDFTDRTVVSVGAGGGQLVEYARRTRRVIAIDQDAAAMQKLAERLRDCGLTNRFTLVRDDFLATGESGSVVLFEFCLHEMADPKLALAHARRLAPDIVVIDHAPGSPWAWYAAEEEKVQASWAAVEREPIRRGQSVEAHQHFNDYADLETKVAPQGAVSLERIDPLRGQKAIIIPMPYRLVLL